MRLSLLLHAALLCLPLAAPGEEPAKKPAGEPAAPAIKAGDTFSCKDTLNCGMESNADAADCLKGLAWTPGPFTLTCEAPTPGQGNWLLRYPSPVPSGDAVNDRVAVEWRMATDENDQPVRGPAMVIVHESGRGMVAARVFANGLRAYGIHTFLVHLPGYGARTPAVKPDIINMMTAMKQAVADVRRARDIVTVLPYVDTSRVGVLGISLGGFVTAAVSGLDHGFDKNFILLAGGNLADVILNGTKDAAKIREMLEAAGFKEPQIRESSRPVEPMRIASRVDAARTWLFSGTLDEVVPPASSLAFAKAAGLDATHHIRLPVGHYSAALMLPVIMRQSAALLLGTPLPQAEPEPGNGKD